MIAVHSIIASWFSIFSIRRQKSWRHKVKQRHCGEMMGCRKLAEEQTKRGRANRALLQNPNERVYFVQLQKRTTNFLPLAAVRKDLLVPRALLVRSSLMSICVCTSSLISSRAEYRSDSQYSLSKQSMTSASCTWRTRVKRCNKYNSKYTGQKQQQHK